MLKIVLLILVAEFWGTGGQIFFKKSANSVDTPNLRSPASFLNFIKKIFNIPGTWLGFAFIGIGMVVWLMALAQTDLSIAFPIDSMQYIVALIAARIFLDEKIDMMKLVGTLLVILGIVLVAMS